MGYRFILTFLDATGLETDPGAGLGDAHDLAQMERIAVELRATRTSGTGNLDVTLEDSFDGGTLWNDWIAFTQLTASGAEVKAPTRSPGDLVRVKEPVIGTGTWSIRLKLAADPDRGA